MEPLKQLAGAGVHNDRVHALVAHGLSVTDIWGYVQKYGPTVVTLIEELVGKLKPAK